MICAAPLSRVVQKDFEIWDFADVAGHARAIIDAYLFFRYLGESNGDAAIEQKMAHTIFLYDCTTRLERIGGLLDQEDRKVSRPSNLESEMCSTLTHISELCHRPKEPKYWKAKL
jgi:hypothetical protein